MSSDTPRVGATRAGIPGADIRPWSRGFYVRVMEQPSPRTEMCVYKEPGGIRAYRPVGIPAFSDKRPVTILAFGKGDRLAAVRTAVRAPGS